MILHGLAGIPPFYTVTKSAGFDGTYRRLLRNVNATFTTYTHSVWVRRTVLTGHQGIFAHLSGGGSRVSCLFENTTNKFWIYDNAGGNASRRSTTVFSTTGVWIHLVYAVNAGVPSLYVNGTLDTTWSGTLTGISSGNTICYGGYDTAGPSSHLNGEIAEANFIQGSALTPSDFGYSRAGLWVPKKYAGSYSGNSSFLRDSIAAGTDASGLGNNYTPTNSPANNTISPAIGA